MLDRQTSLYYKMRDIYCVKNNLKTTYIVRVGMKPEEEAFCKPAWRRGSARGS